MCQPHPPEAQTQQLPHIQVSVAALNPSWGCSDHSGATGAMALSQECHSLHWAWEDVPTKSSCKVKPNRKTSARPSDLFTFRWSTAVLCHFFLDRNSALHFKRNVGNKTFSGEGRNSKFLKITVKSISKQTQGVVFSHLPFLFFPPESPFQLDFPQDVNIVLGLMLTEAR